MPKNITVLKFGGSVLRSEEDVPTVVHEVYRHWRRGAKVLVVVSAFGGTTDELIARTRSYGDEPHPESIATLLFTGEATAASFVGLALRRAGVPVKLLTPEQAGIITKGEPLDSEPVSLNVERIHSELEDHVVVISGFAGVSPAGDLTLLGRGGTDLTALFLARHLNARCVLVKDVDGMYESKPTDDLPLPRRFVTASYETTSNVCRELVQTKAVAFAARNDLEFEIAAIGSRAGTRIGNFIDELGEKDNAEPAPLRVALLGCGTVGGGVYHRLSALSDHFEVTGVVNLDPDKAIANGVRAEQIEQNARKLIEHDCDVVVELIGGIEPAWSLIEFALDRKRHVVTANKALIAEHGPELEARAAAKGVSLRYSAAVGGSTPAFESVTSVARSAPLRSLRGIINGTCNYICDQLAKGVDFHTALNTAQIEGYAEADPTLDLDGTDAAQKLVLLTRAAFGHELPLADVERRGIDTLTSEEIERARENKLVYRLVAECTRDAGGYRASVTPVLVSPDDPFGRTRGADNCVFIETEAGEQVVVRGRGAGRHATTEPVLADLFDVRDAAHSSTANHQTREAAA